MHQELHPAAPVGAARRPASPAKGSLATKPGDAGGRRDQVSRADGSGGAAAAAASPLAKQRAQQYARNAAAGADAPASLMMRISFLAAALDQIGAVQISARMVKVPREFMRAALQRAVHELLDTCIASGVRLGGHAAWLSVSCVLSLRDLGGLSWRID